MHLGQRTVCESCLRTRHIGLMMGIDFRKSWAFVTVLLVLSGAGAAFGLPVKDTVLDRVGLIDARRPEGVASLVTSARAPSGKWRFLRLSVSAAMPVECCIEAGGTAASSVLQLSGDEVVATVAQAATFEPALKQGFIGLAVRGDIRVRVVSAHRVVLSWPNQARRLRVDHCLSAEGLHVLLRGGRHGRFPGPTLHYYVPLGMDVTADCTPVLLAEGSVGLLR